uniref:Uncharacterized protein n=1 Tax=uncultured Thiotrichaceae bacterium TaxID=298394 RepID=A0A6S6UD99_9GAMM|nr:MAG: Unknown protein [uncultured Thiotrichaceae bacterium]
MRLVVCMCKIVHQVDYFTHAVERNALIAYPRGQKPKKSGFSQVFSCPSHFLQWPNISACSQPGCLAQAVRHSIKLVNNAAFNI